MDNLWNFYEISPPPNCTVKTSLSHKSIANLKEVLYDALNTLKMPYLDKEAAYLARILYKHKRMYRHSKETQYLSMIYQCLKKYLKLNLLRTIDNYKQSFPANIRTDVTHAFLPTKQMLMWVLFRLQSFSQLFVRMIDLCKNVALFIYSKMCLGWNLRVCLISLAITARLLVCSQYLMVKSIEWYNSLYKYLPCFKLTAEFLKDHNFPSNLKHWLGDIDLTPPEKKTYIDDVFEMIDLSVAVGDDEDDDDIKAIKVIQKSFLNSLFKTDAITIDSDVEEITTETKPKKVLQKKKPVFQDEDLGIPVDDDESDIMEIPKKKFKSCKGEQKVNKKRHKNGKYFGNYRN